MGDNREQIEKKADDIAELLKQIRYNPQKRAHELVDMIENKYLIEEKFHLSKSGTRQHKNIKAQYKKFSHVYLMKIFLEFIVDEYDAEMTLMAYGFIDGYDDNPRGKRYEKYWEHAHIYIERINKREKTKAHLIQVEVTKIIKELSNTLAEIIIASNGTLNFFDEVFEDFSNNIPEKIPLPITDYLENKSFAKVDDDRSRIKVQHYRIIKFKVSICGNVQYNHNIKIPIAGDADEEDEHTFDISKEHIMTVLAGMVCLMLCISANKTGQDSTPPNALIAEEYSMEPLRNDTLEEGQKKQALIPIIAPCKEVISQDTVSGSVVPPK